MMADKNRRDQLKALFETVETTPAPEQKPAEHVRNAARPLRSSR